jgi:2-keto-4-pentenoate hydratase
VTAQQTASLLLRARTGRRSALEPLPDGAHPTTLEAGIAAQVELAVLVAAMPPAGFKIGATSKRMQDFLGLAGPAAGFMQDANLHASGSTLAFGQFFRPGVECELAVLLDHDLPPGPCTPDAARAAAGELMPAIEIVENRYADLAAFGAPAMVADQVFHAAAIIGTPVPAWRDLDLLAIHGAISVNGQIRDDGHGRDLLGGPWDALAWLAQSAEAAAFGGLRAGQIVMLGSVCPVIWLDTPARIEVSFPPFSAVHVHLA